MALALLMACLALLALTAAGPKPAGAAGEPGFNCKKIHGKPAQVNPNPGGRPPVAIGDSTMLLPIPNLTAVGYSVNARGCRGFREAVNIATRIKRKRKLPHLVLTNAYGNGGVNPTLIADMLAVLGPRRVLVLVTAYNADTGKPPAPDTDQLFKAQRQYPHRIAVLDWVDYSRSHHKAEPKPDAWFEPDLFHPNFAGADAYAQFLATALPLAKNGAFPPL
jgi:hypothetical protein